MKKLLKRLTITGLSIAAVDQSLQQYYKYNNQEVPYYNPFKMMLRSSRVVFGGVQMMMIYSKKYSSEGKL